MNKRQGALTPNNAFLDEIKQNLLNVVDQGSKKIVNKALQKSLALKMNQLKEQAIQVINSFFIRDLSIFFFFSRLKKIM